MDPRDWDWPVLESSAEYETGWYTGGYDRVEQPDGTEKNYYWADLPDAVVVVARKGEAVVFIEQYRPPIREHCLELVAGIVEEGESYEEAALRELREETGYEAANPELLQTFNVATGVLRHGRGIVVADVTGESEDGRALDTNEFIEVTERPADEALAAAREQPANDATIEGLLLARADGYL